MAVTLHLCSIVAMSDQQTHGHMISYARHVVALPGHMMPEVFCLVHASMALALSAHTPWVRIVSKHIGS